MLKHSIIESNKILTTVFYTLHSLKSKFKDKISKWRKVKVIFSKTFRKLIPLIKYARSI